MSDYHFSNLSSQNNYESSNVQDFNEWPQQRFGYPNPQQGFNQGNIPSIARQHSTENISRSHHSLSRSNLLERSDAASFFSQNMPFMTQKSQGTPCTQNTFHPDNIRDSKPFPPPLPPPPMPPPFLPRVEDCRPPLCPPPCPPRLPISHSSQKFCPARFSADMFRLPPPSNRSDSKQGFKYQKVDAGAEQDRPFPLLKETSSEGLSSNSVEDEEQTWMRSWISKVTERLNQRKEKTPMFKSFKVSDIQKKLLKYASLTLELEKVLEQFSREQSDEDTEKLYMKSEFLIQKIGALQSYFGEEKNVKEIKEMLDNRREKRLKTRKLKKIKAERRRKLKASWKEKERSIDQKLKQIYEQEKSKIIEEKVKKEADMVLREVRTKQEEVYKMQKLLESLSQLRDTRMKKGEVHGYVKSPQANSFFIKLQDEFSKLLPNQLDLYRGEEQTLKVMMEESKSTLSLSSAKALHSRIPSADKLKTLIYEILFGKKIPREKWDDFQRSFCSAEESVEMLINRRHDWDQFLVDWDSPMGSSVPVGWVVPNTEPNPDWREFQRE